MKTKEEILAYHKSSCTYAWGSNGHDMATLTPDIVALRAMQNFSDQETEELNQELAESNRTISNLRQRLADCQRKGLTGERI